MTAQEQKQLAVLEQKVDDIKTVLDEIKNGKTPNCAIEKERMDEAQKQIENLWKTRASAISLNLLWAISVSLYCALIIYLVTH